jgi:SHS2 domain-containing protein
LNSHRFYEIVEHTADVGIRVEAEDRPGIFRNAARAMFDMMFGLQAIGRSRRRRIEVTADSLEELLVSWLNEVLYVHAVEKTVFSDFTDPQLSGNRFSAWCVGENLDPAVHRCDMEIKAATYHGLSFQQSGGKWVAKIIFDV